MGTARGHQDRVLPECGGFGRALQVSTCVLSVTIGSLVVGCGESTSTSRSANVEIDTLAGGGTIVRNGSEGMWRGEERWRLEEDVRIGQRDGDGPATFGRVQALAVDPSGRIWVADGVSADIRVFEPDGRPVRTVGRSGGGPGEFNVPMAMARGPEGSMWVSDPRQGRIQVFDTAGELIAAHSFPRGSPAMEPVVFDSSGLVLHVVPGPGPRRQALRTVRRDPIGFKPLDTLPSVELLAEPVRFSDREARPTGARVSTVRSIPFVHQPELRLQAGTSRFIGWSGGGEYRFGSFRLDGDTVLLIERDYEPVAIPPEVVEDRLGRLGPAAAALPSDQVPETYPPFDEVHGAPDGHWWVRRTLGPERAIYEVFAPDGTFLGPVETDVDLSSFELMHLAHDALYGVWRGPLDTPYVVRLVVRKEPVG